VLHTFIHFDPALVGAAAGGDADADVDGPAVISLAEDDDEKRWVSSEAVGASWGAQPPAKTAGSELTRWFDLNSGRPLAMHTEALLDSIKGWHGLVPFPSWAACPLSRSTSPGDDSVLLRSQQSRVRTQSNEMTASIRNAVISTLFWLEFLGLCCTTETKMSQ
jgi:hypothetical protein